MFEEEEAYDQTTTTFSPDGRLLQVEYARSAVSRGTTAVALRFLDGALIAVAKKVPSKLVEPAFVEKIFNVSDHIVCACSGLVADARVLVEYAREIAQDETFLYDQPAPVSQVVQRVADVMRLYTQFGAVRPFGVSFLFAGVDDGGPHVFEVDISGAVIVHRAAALGEHAEEAVAFFNEAFKDDMSENLAVKTAVHALLETEGSLRPELTEVVVVRKGKPYATVPETTIAAVIEASG